MNVPGASKRRKKCSKEALTLAQTAGYQRLFLDEGAEMAALLKGIVSEVRAPLQVAFLRTLLRGFTTIQPSTTPASGDDVLEPLSPQERRVLTLLVAGHTTRRLRAGRFPQHGENADQEYLSQTEH